jgi:hypothetical protein
MKPACENVAVFVLVAQLEKDAAMFGRVPENQQLMKAQLPGPDTAPSAHASLVLPVKMQFVTFIHPLVTASTAEVGVFE